MNVFLDIVAFHNYGIVKIMLLLTSSFMIKLSNKRVFYSHVQQCIGVSKGLRPTFSQKNINDDLGVQLT